MEPDEKLSDDWLGEPSNLFLKNKRHPRAGGSRPCRSRARVRQRRRPAEAEYRKYGLEVVAYRKREPPTLRCPTCGQEWLSRDWKCPSGDGAAVWKMFVLGREAASDER